MYPRSIFAAIVFATASASGQIDDKEFLARYENTFEPGGNLPAEHFVPKDRMEGKLHRVRPLTVNDGLNNSYFLDTPSGVAEVTGTTALLTRIREIYAIDYLQSLSKTEEFGKALAKSVGAKVESVTDVVRDPFGAVRNIPKGASRFFGRIGEGLKGGASNTEGGSVVRSLTGVTKAKAQLAAKLGINPYTSNEELQRELDGTAQAMAGGGLIVTAASSLASGGAGVALTAVGVNQSLQDTLANSTPEDLRIANRKKLLALGVSRESADEFLMHPWYSPWHETIITEAVAKIDVDPGAFLAQACRALTPEDAFFFQRIAELLARYHASTAPLRAIKIQNGIICAVDRNGTIVVPLSCDYAIWAERAARRVEEFVASAKDHPEIHGLALWVDGRISDRLAQELSTLHVTVKTNALDE